MKDDNIIENYKRQQYTQNFTLCLWNLVGRFFSAKPTKLNTQDLQQGKIAVKKNWTISHQIGCLLVAFSQSKSWLQDKGWLQIHQVKHREPFYHICHSFQWKIWAVSSYLEFIGKKKTIFISRSLERGKRNQKPILGNWGISWMNFTDSRPSKKVQITK